MIYSELRQDPITGIWVNIAGNRSNRPDNFSMNNGKEPPPDYDSKCVLCVGNENLTPPELLAYRRDGVWWARTVPNKFPALSLDARIDEHHSTVNEGMFVRMPAYGAHEVIVETASHSQDIHMRATDQVREMLWMYRDRLVAHHSDKGLENVLIFKNKGSEAGASLEHPHSQLTASPVHMQRLDSEMQGAERYFLGQTYSERKGACVYCDMVNQELETRDRHGIASELNRVVSENIHYVAFLPFASQFPFETWIVPKTHQSDYTFISPDEVTSLAIMVKDVFRKLQKALPHFDYNMVLHTTPLNNGALEYYHWHFEITPRITKIAGFEIGSGNHINIVPPEKAAKFLNSSS